MCDKTLFLSTYMRYNYIRDMHILKITAKSMSVFKSMIVFKYSINGFNLLEALMIEVYNITKVGRVKQK